MMWYDDKYAREAMEMIGLNETDKGHWISPDSLKELSDFDGGVVMITRLWHDKPEFDIKTVHMGQNRDGGFLNECLKEHIAAIQARTEDILKRGQSAIKVTKAS